VTPPHFPADSVRAVDNRRKSLPGNGAPASLSWRPDAAVSSCLGFCRAVLAAKWLRPRDSGSHHATSRHPAAAPAAGTSLLHRTCIIVQLVGGTCQGSPGRRRNPPAWRKNRNPPDSTSRSPPPMARSSSQVAEDGRGPTVFSGLRPAQAGGRRRRQRGAAPRPDRRKCLSCQHKRHAEGRFNGASSVSGTALELSQSSPENPPIFEQGRLDSGPPGAPATPDPTLTLLANAWPSLSPANRKAVLAIVRQASARGERRKPRHPRS
jgi:hypothetical protein